MAITTVDGIVAAVKQRVEFYKTASRTTVAGGWFCNFDVAGNPAAGTLAVGNTANGIVPTDAIGGYPAINAFSGSKGYLSRLFLKNSVVGIIRLFDCVFAAGAYAFNADVTLASQPSYAGRLSPAGDYRGLELWAEAATAATGNLAVQVNYTDAADGAGDTGAIGVGAAPTLGRCWPIPLQAAHDGVKTLTRIRGSVATVGTFNVRVLRPLADIYITVASMGVLQNWMDLGLPEVFADSALYMLLMSPSGTALGTMDVGNLDIING